MDDDPITQFFPGETEVDLYSVLSLTNNSTLDAIKKAYRHLALICHPDKHATASEQVKAEASLKFQKIGFAYAVLSDEKRKKRYDQTGKTDEGFELAAGDDGWEAYFEDLFERVTRGQLDEMKKEYQGSSQEVEDLKSAYLETNGSIGDILTYIPHSTYEDEARFVLIISSLISKGDLRSTREWEKSARDEKAKLMRKNEGEKEAEEAEELAKELGVWDEFFGSGKVAKKKKSKGKGKANKADEEEEDHSTLQALILKKKEKDLDGFFNNLAAKYAEPKIPSHKGKKRAHEDEEHPSPKKKSRQTAAAPPVIDDEEFAKLQQRLFGSKDKVSDRETKIKRGKGKRAK